MNQRARKEMTRTETQLRLLGYSVSGYGDERHLAIGYGIVPKPVLKFDDQTDQAKSALTTMKRTYTLKLFAGGEEAKELFSSLAAELATIVS